MPSQFDTIPTPRALHQRAEFGQREVSVGNLPFFSIVKSYLTESLGEGYCFIDIGGFTSREVVNIVIPCKVFYEQSMLVAQHLWDMGYYIAYKHPKLPGCIPQDSGVPELYISWNPTLVNKRGLPCPCWACKLAYDAKHECAGCNAFSTWQKQGGRHGR